jgi:hypothetical protein
MADLREEWALLKSSFSPEAWVHVATLVDGTYTPCMVTDTPAGSDTPHPPNKTSLHVYCTHHQ